MSKCQAIKKIVCVCVCVSVFVCVCVCVCVCVGVLFFSFLLVHFFTSSYCTPYLLYMYLMYP